MITDNGGEFDLNKKFIYTKSVSLKNTLLTHGYKLISTSGEFFIFRNKPTMDTVFSKIDKSKYILTNTLMF